MSDEELHRVYFDAAKERFASEERATDRFIARIRALLVVLTGLGAGAWYLGGILIDSGTAAAGPWWSVAAPSILCGVAVLLGFGFLAMLFIADSYAKWPAQAQFEAALKLARERADAKDAGSATDALLEEMAAGLLSAAEQNSATNKRREAWLDRAKAAAFVAAMMFGAGLVLTLKLRWDDRPANHGGPSVPENEKSHSQPKPEPPPRSEPAAPNRDPFPKPGSTFKGEQHRRDNDTDKANKRG